MQMDFTKMTGPQMVAAYNATPGVKPVKKFKDRETAITRLTAVKQLVETTNEQPVSGVGEVQDDGLEIPGFCKLTPEQRKASWDKNPPKARPAAPALSVPKPEVQAKAAGSVNKKAAGKATTTNSKLAAEFEARAGTNRETLLVELEKSFGKQIKTADLCVAVYGPNGKIGPLMMVLKGAEMTIAKKKLPYIIKKVDATIGIHKK